MCIDECRKNALGFSPQQTINMHNADDYISSAKGSIFEEVSNKNMLSPLQTESGKRNRFGMRRHQRKGHRRGWFHKNGRRNNRD